MRAVNRVVAVVLLCLATPAWAGERVTLGFGRLFTNDYLGDNDDRWRSGSFVLSWMRGPEGLQGRPDRPGQLMEYRFGSAVISPSNLTNPKPADRRYVGMLSWGVHTHFARAGYEVSLGADLVVTGPQTGVGQFQAWFHNALNVVPPSAAALANQIPNGIHPTALAEVARPFHLSDRITLRPFAEAQAGAETFLRLGGDVLIGPGFRGPVFLRDVSTGLLYRATHSAPRAPGVSLLLGGDVARVWGSVYLPGGAGGPGPRALRSRARIGINLQGRDVGLFYGATWLGPEYQGQTGGQLLGSVRLKVAF